MDFMWIVVCRGHGKKSAPTEETLVLLNSNAIMSPECEVWKDFCNLRAASDNRIFTVWLFVRRLQSKKSGQKTQLWIIRNYLYGFLGTCGIYKPDYGFFFLLLYHRDIFIQILVLVKLSMKPTSVVCYGGIHSVLQSTHNAFWCTVSTQNMIGVSWMTDWLNEWIISSSVLWMLMTCNEEEVHWWCLYYFLYSPTNCKS